MLRVIVVLMMVAAVQPLAVEGTASPCDAPERCLEFSAPRHTDDPTLSNFRGGVVQRISPRGGPPGRALNEGSFP
jgi:hypothetical protein